MFVSRQRNPTPNVFESMKNNPLDINMNSENTTSNEIKIKVFKPITFNEDRFKLED